MVVPNNSETCSPICSVGQIVDGRYEIVNFIAHGAFSSVFKVRHLLTGQMAALKILDPLVASSAVVERFEREARTLSSLSHSNIVTFYTFGTCNVSGTYIVLEYIEGHSLAELISSQGVLAPEILVKLSLDVCAGMSYAHLHNVFHRDLKPANILVTSEGTAKIVDFGIAELLVSNDQRLTHTNALLGTPAYMSPEQCTGQSVDARSEIYSLGCIMYEGLTGHAPFKAESALGLMACHVQNDITTVPLPCDIPSKLHEAVLQCLRRKPADRFGSMEELQAALERINWDTGRIHRPRKARGERNLRSVALCCGAVILLMILTGGFYWKCRQSAPIETATPASLSVGRVLRERDNLIDRYDVHKRVDYYKLWLKTYGKKAKKIDLAEASFSLSTDLQISYAPTNEIDAARVEAIKNAEDLMSDELTSKSARMTWSVALSQLYVEAMLLDKAKSLLLTSLDKYANTDDERSGVEHCLAGISLRLNDYKNAEQYARCSMRKNAHAVARNAGRLLLVRVLWLENKRAEAETELNKVRKVKYDGHDLKSVRWLEGCGATEALMLNYENAARYYESAITLCRAGSTDEELLARLLRERGVNLQKFGRAADARICLEEAVRSRARNDRWVTMTWYQLCEFCSTGKLNMALLKAELKRHSSLSIDIVGLMNIVMTLQSVPGAESAEEEVLQLAVQECMDRKAESIESFAVLNRLALCLIPRRLISESRMICRILVADASKMNVDAQAEAAIVQSQVAVAEGNGEFARSCLDSWRRRIDHHQRPALYSELTLELARIEREEGHLIRCDQLLKECESACRGVIRGHELANLILLQVLCSLQLKRPVDELLKQLAACFGSTGEDDAVVYANMLRLIALQCAENHDYLKAIELDEKAVFSATRHRGNENFRLIDLLCADGKRFSNAAHRPDLARRFEVNAGN